VTPIHDAHPDAAYEYIDPQTLQEWRGFSGEKLLAIPFKNDARNPQLHEEISNHIFAAVVEITQSPDLGVAAPLPNEEGRRRRLMPITFLVYNLSELHREILLQQTVWASTTITFRITTPPMKCPTFLFAIKGLRTLEPNLVRNTVREMWGDETTSKFINDGIQALDKELHNSATETITAFMDSMWVTRLDTRDRGSALKPTFNIYANGTIINDVRSWTNIRTHLANRNYHSSRLGQGHVETTPRHCGLCHGVDHPKGLCPFPAIEDWRGPKRKTLIHNQKRGTPNRNAARTPPDGWN
jgi:hypothetical protein